MKKLPLARQSTLELTLTEAEESKPPVVAAFTNHWAQQQVECYPLTFPRMAAP